MRGDIGDVILELERRLGAEHEWIIGGSTALMLRGVPVIPNDIDIWCTQEALVFFAEHVRRSLQLFEDEWVRHSTFNYCYLGWTIEVIGRSVILRTGCVLEPDDEMFRRAHSPARVESLEDVLCEMLAMDRPAPKRDKERAFDILSQSAHSLDLTYFGSRCLAWRVSRDIYRQALEIYANSHRD
jgi:hypothetical protein